MLSRRLEAIHSIPLWPRPHARYAQVNQLPYSLLCRGIEDEVVPFCRHHGIGITGYMALMQVQREAS